MLAQPTNNSETTAPIGHNNPPEQTLPDRLKEKHATLFAEVEALAARANNAPREIADDEGLTLAAEIGGAAARDVKKIDDARVLEKAPFLKAERDVDGLFNPLKDRLNKIRAGMEARAHAYRSKKVREAEAARLAEQAEAKRLADEARKNAEASTAAGRTDDAIEDLREVARHEEAASAPPPQASPPPAPIKTESGVKIEAKKEWAFEVTDYETIPLDRLRPYLDRAAIDKAIKAYLKVAKGTAALAGVRFYEQEQTKFRG